MPGRLARRMALLVAACLVLMPATRTGGPSATARVGGPTTIAQPEPVSSGRFWRIPDRLSGGIEGYASTTSIAAGGRFALYVSTPARSFVVRAFRMGWYGGRL